uniref:Uncharacterized protein LOC104265996 n=1 Tax=Phallusia mammillata TaxID=59560 RepID=A0A6F9DJ71_9ASCI|nr:uncharacterized protein LOC104265996 [Phallusia mammillata]
MSKERKRSFEETGASDEPEIKVQKKERSTTIEQNDMRNEPNKILCLIDVDSGIKSSIDKEVNELQNPLKEIAYSYEEVLDIIEEYEVSTVTKFLQVLDKKYDTSKSLLHWDLTTGIPYVIAGYSRWYCHQSKRRDNTAKMDLSLSSKKEMISKNASENSALKRKYKRVQSSKKCDCQASIVVSHVIQFSQHQLSENGITRRQRSRLNKKILSAFRSQDNSLIQDQLYLIKFPAIEEHTGHVVGREAGLFQPIDRKLILKISQLVDSGIHEIKKLKGCLEDFVVNELFCDLEPPSKSNRRFYPTEDNLRSHRKRALARQKKSHTDSSYLNLLNVEENKSSEQNNGIFVLVDVDDQRLLGT